MFPYLIAGAIGYAVAKIFEDDKTPKYSDGGLVVGENDDDNKFPTKEEAFELIQDSIESQGTYFIDEEGDGMFDSEEQAQRYVDEVYDIFDAYYSMEMIPVYRVVEADEVDLDPYSIGESWSMSLDSAKNFGNHLGVSSKKLKIISGYVPSGNVDWESAFRLYVVFSDLGDGDSEFELPIPSNNKIFDVRVSDFKEAKELEPYKFADGGQTPPYVSDDFQIGYDGAYEHLIAPNGELSNLTPEQYKLVRTPAFKKWFGDWENDPANASKVVDSNGEPLVCYHTSDKKFTKFNYKLSYDGAIWFTENIQKIIDNETGAGKTGVVYEVFLDIKKMGDWDDYDKGIDELLRDKFNGAKMDDDYIVFEPEQIKLADGTNTTFDGSNPDIRFKKGGSVGVNNDITYEIIDDEFGFLVLIKNNNEKIGEIFFEKDRDNSFTITDAVIDTKFKGNRIYPNAIIEILNRKPNITINSVFRSSDAEKSWDYLLKNLPKNIQQKKQHFKDENTTLYQISVNKNTKYDDGGSILLAPNGKPSNLTFKQYKLVRTPEFKAWFGDWQNDPANASKVVDSNGEPLLVYHGTGKKFNIFKKESLGNYFSDKYDVAKEFAEESAYSSDITILQCFLDIKKPFVEDKKGDDVGDPSIRYDFEKPIFTNYKYDGLIYLNVYDSINYDTSISNVFATKNPNQIKLADGTNTTFDSNNPDIRYAGGGKVKKVKFDIDDDEEERVTISIKGIGKVILAVTYPEYEFLEDIGEDGLEELGVEEGDMIGKIEHLEIEDKYKGQGYAKLLMNKAIEVAKEKGLMPLYLNASPMGSKRYGLDLYDLTSFYESLGFEVFLEQGNNNLMILKESNNTDNKYEDGGLVDDIFTLNTYIVQTGDDSYSHEEYSGDDYDEALSIYNGITPNDFVRPNSDYNYKNLTKNSVEYKFIGELEEGYEISDFTDNLDDNDYWEYIGDDYEDLLGDKVEAINEVTDDYISEIQDFINNEYVKDRFSSKYMSIDVYSDEEQENHLDHITIRTTDHSQNPANKKGRYNLSFVIADANDTKHRWRSRDEYYFDSSDDIEDIKSEIITIIEEKIQEVKDDYE